MLQRVLAAATTRHGKQHPQTVAIIGALADSLNQQGRVDDALRCGPVPDPMAWVQPGHRLNTA